VLFTILRDDALEEEAPTAKEADEEGGRVASVVRAVGPTVREEGAEHLACGQLQGRGQWLNTGVAAPTWRYVSYRGDPDDNINDDSRGRVTPAESVPIFETGRGTWSARSDPRQGQSFRTSYCVIFIYI